jgi:membrane protein implicated in regulation of membrane protease activity
LDALKSYYEISPFFFIITASATLLYLTMNLIMIFGGGEVDDYSDDFSTDLNFKFFSTQTVLAFCMGFGWAGITSTVSWKLPQWQAILVAFTFGLCLMTFSAFMLSKIRQLNHTPARNIYSSLGSRGKVYAQIPFDGEGEVEVKVSGALRIVKAIAEEEISSFTEVEVIGVRDSQTIIVKRTETKIPEEN